MGCVYKKMEEKMRKYIISLSIAVLMLGIPLSAQTDTVASRL